MEGNQLRYRPLAPQFRTKMGPLDPSHPAIGKQCEACTENLKAGDYVTLVSVGPGDDPEEQEKARAGRPFNAVAVIVHAACAGVE